MFSKEYERNFSQDAHAVTQSRVNHGFASWGGGNEGEDVKDKRKIRLVLFLVLAFFMSFWGVRNVSAIDYPVACNIKGYSDNNSAYNFVYFGEADSTKAYSNPIKGGDANATSNYVVEGQSETVTKAPIKFRVLQTTSNGYDAASGSTNRVPALFMLTEYAVGKRRWDTGTTNENHNAQDWETSEMRAWLNGTSTTDRGDANIDYGAEGQNSVFKTLFDSRESAVLMPTTTEEEGLAIEWAWSGQYNRWAGPRDAEDGDRNRPNKTNQLNGDKIFLLSAEEVIDKEYGFADNLDVSVKDKNKWASLYPADASRKCYLANAGTKSGSGSWWWLRSACSSNSVIVADVLDTGASLNAGSDDSDGAIRFALNVPLNKIVYTAPAVSTITAPGFVKVPETTPIESKLTILDSDRSEFSVTKNSVSTRLGEKIRLHYVGATAGENEYISVIVRDVETKEALYYGYFDKVTDSEGDVNIPLPQDIPAGSYKLVVMNEQRNADKHTNYAGCVEITLNVTDTYPVMCDILNPKVNSEDTWKYDYNYVYFGEATTDTYTNTGATTSQCQTENQGQFVTEGESATAPIKFRVLNTTSNGYDAASGSTNRVPALFMLTEYAVGQRRWDVTGSEATAINTNTGNTHNRQEWLTSEIRAWLNGTSTIDRGDSNIDYGAEGQNSVFKTLFDSREGAILMPTTTEESGDALSWYSDNSCTRWAGKYTNAEHTERPTKSNWLAGDRIFLLSAEEVTNEEYGFANNAVTTNNIYPSYNAGNNNSRRSYSRICYMAGNNNSYYDGDSVKNVGQHTAGESGWWWWLRSTYSYYSYSIAEMAASVASVGYNCYVTDGAVRFALNIPLDKIVYTAPATNSDAPGFVKVPETTPTESKLTILDSSRSEFATTSNSMLVLIDTPVNIGYSGAKVGTNEYISAIIKDADTGKALYYGYFENSAAEGNISITLPEDVGFGTYKLILMNEQRNADKYTNYAGCSEIMLTVCDYMDPVVTDIYKNGSNTRFKLTASDNVELSKITTEDGILIDDTISGKNNVTKNITSSKTNAIKVVDSSNNEKLVDNIPVDNLGPVVESITYDGKRYTIRVSDLKSGIWKITNGTGDVIYERYDGLPNG